jgi:ribonuclease HI
MENREIHIHTDGSCSGNPGPGGWGAVIHFDDEEIKISGGVKDTTNNRMEMTAIIEALKWLREKDLLKGSIEIFSDSNFIIQTMNKGWKKKANQDLWAEMDKQRAWLNIKWTWVKGHADNKYNNLADELAVSETQKFLS